MVMAIVILPSRLRLLHLEWEVVLAWIVHFVMKYSPPELPMRIRKIGGVFALCSNDIGIQYYL